MRLAIDPAEVAPRIPFAAIRRERERAESAMRTRRALDDVLSRAAVARTWDRPPLSIPAVVDEPEPVVVVAPEPTEPEPEPEPETTDAPPRQMRRLQPILSAVAEVTGLHRNDIAGPRQTKVLCLARFAFVLIARRYTCRSLPEIGRAIGGRDHTTVIHAARRAAGLEETDQDFAALVTKAAALAAKKEARHD